MSEAAAHQFDVHALVKLPVGIFYFKSSFKVLQTGMAIQFPVTLVVSN